MIKYKIKGEQEPVELTGPEALVQYLNETSEHSSVDSRSYMLDYAKRSVIFRNVDIRATDFNSFVDDLIAHGDIELVQ